MIARCGRYRPAVATSEIHLWRFALDAEPHDRALLSGDERARADRFLADVHRDRYVAGRARLRRVLGGLLDRDPSTLRFAYGDAGKPRVEDAGALEFNLAHSGDGALLAVAHGRAVGVDLERIRPGRDVRAIAERFFADVETDALRRLAPDESERGFFRLWTRKEALLKGLGDGIGGMGGAGLREVVVGADLAARVTVVDAPDGAVWTIADLEAGDGFAAALAVPGAPGAIVPRSDLV